MSRDMTAESTAEIVLWQSALQPATGIACPPYADTTIRFAVKANRL